jgi:hypothetical protein
MKISRVFFLAFLLLSPYLIAEEEVEIESNMKLTVVPTELSGTLSPFTLLMNEKKILEKPFAVSKFIFNGVTNTPSKDTPNTFFETSSDNVLNITLVFTDGRTENLEPIELPTLDSLQLFAPSRLVMYMNGKVQEIYIDKNKISTTGQATTIPNSPYWFGFNHIVRLEGPADKPDRIYNMKLFKKEEFVAFKEQGELKPGEPLKNLNTPEKPKEITPLRFRLRFEAGMSSKNVITDPPFATNALTSFTGGLYAEFPLSHYFSILFGGAYVQKGASIPVLKNKFTYLELATFFQAKVDDWKIKPIVQVGADFGILLSAFREFSSGTITNIFNVTESIDYGVLAGAGFEAPISKSFSFYALMRYEWGIYDIDPDPATVSKNTGFRILGGVAWAL